MPKVILAIFDHELCSNVLKEALLLLLCFLGLAGNHEKKCSKSNKKCARKQKMCKGTKNAHKGFCGTLWFGVALYGFMWPCLALYGLFLPYMATYGLTWSYMTINRLLDPVI